MFTLEATTWENDGDHYSTQTLMNLTQADVLFYSDILNAFSSKNDRGNPGLGNEEHTEELYEELATEWLAKHPDISEHIKTEWTEELAGGGYAIYEILCDQLLGDTVEYDYLFARVVDSYNVIEITADTPLGGLTVNWVKTNPEEAHKLLVQQEAELRQVKDQIALALL